MSKTRKRFESKKRGGNEQNNDYEMQLAKDKWKHERRTKNPKYNDGEDQD